MADYVEIFDGFIKGRKTRRGHPLPTAPEPVVTLVSPASIDAFLGARDLAERLRHLRRLRDEGVLIHNRGRLTQAVRGQGVARAYCFRCPADQVLRIERDPHTSASGRARILVV
jgi:hypothetical protein